MREYSSGLDTAVLWGTLQINALLLRSVFSDSRYGDELEIELETQRLLTTCRTLTRSLTLTKVMSPEELVEVLDLNFWSAEQPIESLMKKRAKQAQRKAKKVKDIGELGGDIENAPEQQLMGE